MYHRSQGNREWTLLQGKIPMANSRFSFPNLHNICDWPQPEVRKCSNFVHTTRGQQQTDAKQPFIGNYRMCEYVNEMVVDTGTGRVECDYMCSCGEDVCSAVYIFASIKIEEENQEICDLYFT